MTCKTPGIAALTRFVIANPILANPILASPILASLILAGPFFAGPFFAGPIFGASALAQPAPGQTSAGQASASDLTIVSGDLTYVIKKIDLTGTSLDNAGLAALFDPANTQKLETRIKALNAKSITIPTIVFDDKTTDSVIHGEMNQVVLGDVADGRIGTAAIGTVTISGKGDGGTIVKTGAISAAGLDAALFDRLVQSQRTSDSEPLAPLADRFEIHDISISDPKTNSTLTIALFTGQGLKARPLRSDLQALRDAARPPVSVKGDATDTEAEADTAGAKAARTKAIAYDILSSFEAEAMSVESVAFASTGTKENGPVEMRAAKIALAAYKDRRFGNLALRNFYLDGEHLRLTFGDLTLTNLDLPGPGKAVSNLAAGALTTDGFPVVAKAELNHLAFDSDPHAAAGTSKVQFEIAHIASASDRAQGELPARSAITLDHLTFDLPPAPAGVAAELEAMGYKSVDLSGAIATKFDAEAATLNVQTLNVNGVGFGALTLALDLANVNKGILSSNPAIQKASALAVLLKHLDLRLDNGGFFDKIIPYKAAQNGLSVEEERVSEQDFFAVQLPMLAGNDPGLQSAGAAISKFIGAPKNLHISVTSKDGLGASDVALIGNPAAILSRLEIKADANK